MKTHKHTRQHNPQILFANLFVPKEESVYLFHPFTIPHVFQWSFIRTFSSRLPDVSEFVTHIWKLIFNILDASTIRPPDVFRSIKLDEAKESDYTFVGRMKLNGSNSDLVTIFFRKKIFSCVLNFIKKDKKFVRGIIFNRDTKVPTYFWIEYVHSK